ncbi:hypothetical protein AU374_05913 [Cupriavidus metallidurans]|jgi:hypothetical protein|nr:hypothetical protein C3Z06_32420 [Cupriavidus metallidurans]KWW32313.1 hypothetical protein AU374_05913 [Cupriavidus metallidurans]
MTQDTKKPSVLGSTVSDALMTSDSTRQQLEEISQTQPQMVFAPTRSGMSAIICADLILKHPPATRAGRRARAKLRKALAAS